ncbi:MAG: hypothetical protein IT464_06815 [Planctomycetes bacterium]|nr:hypothetical protein [Planctomycetota bacterium]
MRAAAANAEEVAFVFIGRTVLPYSEGGTPLGEKTVQSAPWFASVALAVFEELGESYWLPDDEERRLLLAEPDAALARFAVDPATFSWQGMPIRFQGESLVIPSVEDLKLPPGGNRGREVGVLTLWGEEGGIEEGLPAYDRRLSATVPLRAKYPAAAAESDRLLNERRGAVLAYWRTSITAELAVDGAVAGRSALTSLARSHSPLGGREYVKTGGHEETVKAQLETCGRCHQAAHKAWSQSRHSHSMATLRTRMRHHDPRCLPCHAMTYSVESARVDATPGHDAVICSSCHKPDKRPQDVCSDCHTAITDPKGVYKSRVKDICPGGTNEGAGENCSRR